MLVLLILTSLFASADWRYRVVVCGDLQVEADMVESAVRQVRQQGCRNPVVVPVAGGDAYVVYGTKIVRTINY